MATGVENVQNVVHYIDRIGTVGLAFIVWALMTGRLITRRENDKLEARCGKLEERLDRALHINDRLIHAGERMAERE